MFQTVLRSCCQKHVIRSRPSPGRCRDGCLSSLGACGCVGGRSWMHQANTTIRKQVSHVSEVRVFYITHVQLVIERMVVLV